LRLERPSSTAEAVAALSGGRALSGGTELVPLLRDGIVAAETLVDVRDAVPRGISGRTIGAGTTLAELEASAEIPTALREACRLAASPQLRNMGSIGGNLLQATRCWYWRLDFPCYLHGGDRCHAKAGAHGEHAVFGNELCASAHPSDPAAALLALGTTVRTTQRELPIAELYRLPTADDRNVTLSDLVSSIDTDRQHGNLSSAIRLFVLDHYQNPTPVVREPAVTRDLIGMRTPTSVLRAE